MTRKGTATGKSELIRARQRMLMDGLDYRRQLNEAREHMTQAEMARTLGISPPSVAKAVKAAEGTPAVLEGFSGATVMEVCQRYAAGLIDYDQVVKELVAWPYIDAGEFDEFGDYSGPNEGTVRDLPQARHLGYIGADVYQDVLQQLAGKTVPQR